MYHRKSGIINTRQTLGKNERLKSRKVIEQLFKEGKAVSAFPVRISYCIVGSSAPIIQAGFTASSRNFKKASDRNRIKRLLRDVYRKEKAALEAVLAFRKVNLAIFIMFTGKELPEHTLIAKKLPDALNKLLQQPFLLTEPETDPTNSPA